MRKTRSTSAENATMLFISYPHSYCDMISSFKSWVVWQFSQAGYELPKITVLWATPVFENMSRMFYKRFMCTQITSLIIKAPGNLGNAFYFIFLRLLVSFQKTMFCFCLKMKETVNTIQRESYPTFKTIDSVCQSSMWAETNKKMKQIFQFCGHWQIKCEAISRIMSTLRRCQQSGTLISAVEQHRMNPWKSVFWKAATDHNLTQVTSDSRNIHYSSRRASQGQRARQLQEHMFMRSPYPCLDYKSFSAMVICIKSEVSAYVKHISRANVFWFPCRQNMSDPFSSEALSLIWDTLWNDSTRFHACLTHPFSYIISLYTHLNRCVIFSFSFFVHSDMEFKQSPP